jgi:outer membrane protein OmpA-like peptidoglycan-associated protein
MANRKIFLLHLAGLAAFLFGTSSAYGQQGPQDRGKITGLSSDKFVEFAPTISADGNTMIIESNKNTKNKLDGDRWELFESKRDASGQWSDPFPITTINEKCNFLAGPSLAYDGNSLYYTAFIEGVTDSEDIFYSTRINDTRWSEPISLGTPVNTNEYEGFPSISADGNSLYFIRENPENPTDKKNKENCFVIFVSHRQPDNTWGIPEALPVQINSGCVRDPRIMADNHTLIFSAIRPTGKGKYDLFQSRKQHDGSWSEPQSLDFINSEENDQSPCIPASGDVLYFYTANDIYAIPIPQEYRQNINVTVRGVVREERSKKPLKATIHVTNLTTHEAIPDATNNGNDGLFSLVLAAGSNYRVEFINLLYQRERVDFNFEKQESYLEVLRDADLKNSYNLTLAVKDKDLGIPLAARVSISSKENVVFNDTLKADALPRTFLLETKNAYIVSSSARRYPEITLPLTFDPMIFNNDTAYSLLLTHEKVKFLSDVIEVTSNKRVKTKVYFNDKNQKEVVIAEAGEVILLRRGDRYQVVTGSDKGYLFTTAEIVAGEGEMDERGQYALKLYLTPITEGVHLTLDNITFGVNSSDLKTSSFLELDRIIELMQQNPGLVIEIAAHTDDQGDDDYNFKLSERRAQSVVSYLTTKGISGKRYVARGYGKTKPVVANDSDETRAQNRRVELLILKAE